ncbi:MAG: mechanosensitive ion channel domain-containing protein [Parvibaculum sp.]|uniref:mechanosensitive ion channel family protein n=1 Tax=Parvibaculum sp. TaxID=2024848 RepID=UPI003264AEE8
MQSGWIDIGEAAAAAEAWAEIHLLSPPAAVQLGLLGLAALVALAVRRLLVPRLQRYMAQGGGRLRLREPLAEPLARLPVLVPVLVAALLVWTAHGLRGPLGLDGELLRIAANLLTAWVVIHLLTSFVRQRGWASFLATLVWLVTALVLLGWLGPLYAALDAVAFTAGEFRISLLGIIDSLALFGLFLLVANFVLRLADARMAHLEGVSPAARVLIFKILRIAVIAGAVVVALTTVGVDLTAIAVFSGAVGVGVGFGLQKVVSNLLSGILLLLDRSLKPGDVIEVGDAYGWIEKMSGRYVTVATRDGKEILIPNEDIITQQVINWSYTDRAIRLRIAVGISYRSSVRQAMALMTEAALAQPRVLSDETHKPVVRLTGFGDSAVDLELRIWVTDPEKGVVNIASDIRLAIWDAFHENGVEFPYPQRDLHIVSAEGLEALAARQGGEGKESEGKGDT